MGKPTGFLEVKRQGMPYRDAATRSHDWDEIALLSTKHALQSQASRCMDCAVPFCQNGSVLAGMTTGCPVYNLIPEWNDLVYRGQWREAYQRLSLTNPFPEFTGRVCPAPCEAGCVAGLVDTPVTIKDIERAIIDRAFDEGWVTPVPPTARSGRRVAVIGSGPAGLAAASVLNRHGHTVTVFERADRLGGLLTYGIPKSKLPQPVVDRRLQVLRDEGVQFQGGVDVGRDVSITDLGQQYDAVLLCCGATVPRDVSVPGRDLGGVHFAMEYLTGNTKSLLDSGLRNGQYISAAGRDVVVIGGGDTAVDCITTALRQDCRSLVQFDIYPQRPDQRAPDNPWPQYPVIHKLEPGQREAQVRFQRDPRAFSTSAVAFLGDASNRVSQVHSVMLDAQRQALPGTERLWDAQLVLLAIGFQGPEPVLFQGLGIDHDVRAGAQDTGVDRYRTAVDGVFVAGDARRGQSLIVWAIQEGKEAAQACHRYLTQRHKSANA